MIYKAGDEIILTEEIVSKMKNWDVSFWRARLEQGRVKGVCFPYRTSRASGRMAIKWKKDGLETNVYALEAAGVLFEKLEFGEISILKCPIQYLSARECVLRGMLEAGETPESAALLMTSVEQGMDKYDVVFYQP